MHQREPAAVILLVFLRSGKTSICLQTILSRFVGSQQYVQSIMQKNLYKCFVGLVCSVPMFSLLEAFIMVVTHSSSWKWKWSGLPVDLNRDFLPSTTLIWWMTSIIGNGVPNSEWCFTSISATVRQCTRPSWKHGLEWPCAAVWC